MKYKIMCVGKIKEAYIRDEIDKLCKIIKNRGNSIDIIEIADVKIPDNLRSDKKEEFLIKECEPMKTKITNSDYVIALCIEGKEISDDELKTYIRNAFDNGKESVVYIIGGSLGLPCWVKNRADLKLSFSKMTFPHQLMRMVLLEEICLTM